MIPRSLLPRIGAGRTAIYHPSGQFPARFISLAWLGFHLEVSFARPRGRRP